MTTRLTLPALIVILPCTLGPVSAYAFEITFVAHNVPPGLSSNLEVSFQFFMGDNVTLTDRAAVVIQNDQRNVDGHFEIQYEPPELAPRENFDRFYFYGVLYSTDGSRRILGFLPLRYIPEPDPRQRNEFRGGYQPIYTFDRPLTGVADERCWDTPVNANRGRAARESFPFTTSPAGINENPVVTLVAIKDLIENKFINTCPTWNRVRGILRDRMDDAWRKIDPERLSKVLNYLLTVYSYANDQEYKEVPKIYNDILRNLFRSRDGTETIDGKNIREYILDEQIIILRRHFFKVIWQTHFTLDEYLKANDYQRCLRMYNALSWVAIDHEELQTNLSDIKVLRMRLYKMMQKGNDCAAGWADTTEISEIVRFLEREEVGREYMERFALFFDFLDTQSGEMFPRNLERSTDPHLAKEIHKYYEGYNRWLR